MPRIHLILEYDGTDYSGWQRQDNAPTVQQTAEEALLRLTGEKTVLHAASRTDAGVHALGQSAHFDTESRIPPEKFSYAMNALLPPDVRVRSSRLVPGDFHAQRDALGKRYRYLFYNSPHAGAINRRTHAHIYYPMDVSRMAEAAEALRGRHDFIAFAASGFSVKTTVRTIWDARVRDLGEGEIALTVEGDGFLYNMVRIIAGTLAAIGTGRLGEDAIARALASGDRLDLGPTAPALGLTLMKVFYEGDVKGT